MLWLIGHISRSSATEKAKYRQDLPELTRTRDWATAKAEQARKRAENRERDPRLSGQGDEWTEPEPELLQEFVDFQEQRMQEEEDRRLDQRAARLLVEKEDQKKKAEHKEKELEEEILRKHNAKQAEIHNRNAEKKEMLRNELERAGIEAQQIETLLASSILNYSAASESAIKPSGVSMISPQESFAAKNRRIRTRSRSRDSSNQESVKWSLRLPW